MSSLERVEFDDAKIEEHLFRLIAAVEEETGNQRVNWAEDGRRFSFNVNIDDHYKLVCYHNRDGFQLRLEPIGEARFLVEFGFGPRRFSAFGYDAENGVLLLRNIKRLGIAPPSGFQTVEHQNEHYYAVGPVGYGIAHDIVAFYEAGAFLQAGSTAIPANRTLGDLGPSTPSQRAACLVIPRHHPVALRARAWLAENGYILVPPKASRPDFFVEHNGMRFVVEIKPDTSLQSIAAALGQVSIYSQIEQCAGKIVLLPVGDEGHTRFLTSTDPNIIVVRV